MAVLLAGPFLMIRDNVFSDAVNLAYHVALTG